MLIITVRYNFIEIKDQEIKLSNNEQYSFPNPETSDDHGLLMVGGDLSPQRILQAYKQGIFPWYEPEMPVLWWSPNPRLILIPNEFNLSRSLKKSLKKGVSCTIDTAFKQVITACATCFNRVNNTWITEEMIGAYTNLHLLGFAHSFEIWYENNLVGGLYGINLGRAFFGESMFHNMTDASKIALYYLCKTLANWNFDFIDCQIPTNHLQSLGAKIIDRKEFLCLLEKTLINPTKQGLWHFPF